MTDTLDIVDIANDKVFDLMKEKTEALDLNKIEPSNVSDQLSSKEKRIKWFGDEYLEEYQSLESGSDRRKFEKEFLTKDDKNTYRKYRDHYGSLEEFDESDHAGDIYSRPTEFDPSIYEWLNTYNFMERISGEGDNYSHRWWTEDKAGNIIKERTSDYSGVHPDVQITRGEEQVYKEYGIKGWEDINE